MELFERLIDTNGKHWAEVRFDDVATSQLAPAVVLLVYRAIARWNRETTASSTHCTTIYVKKGALWKIESSTSRCRSSRAECKIRCATCLTVRGRKDEGQTNRHQCRSAESSGS